MIIPVWTSFQETTMLVHGSNPCNSMATCLDPAPKTVSTTNCRLKKWPVWYLEAPLELELVKYVKFSVVFYLWFYTWEIPIRKNHWDLQRHSPAPSEGSSGLWAPPATTTGRIIGGIGAKRSCPRKQNLTFWKKSRNIYIYYNIYIYIINYVYIIVWMFRLMFFPNETRRWNRSDNSVMLHGLPSAIESVGWNWAHNPRTLRRRTMVRNLDFCHSEILLVLSA